MFEEVLQRKVDKLKKDIKKVSQLAPLKPHKNTIWSREEDDILSRAVTKYQGRDWESVAKYFENKDATQCLHRWQKVLNPNLKKGKWTEDEDKLLRKYVKLFGDSKWSKVADKIPRRTSKQCRERWKNQLDPTIKRTPWTKEEDKILIEKHKEFGNKWSKIKDFLPGRPDNRIKNRWNSTLKKIVYGLPISQSNKLRKRGRPKGSTTNKNKKQKKIVIRIGREARIKIGITTNKEDANGEEMGNQKEKEITNKDKVKIEEEKKNEEGDDSGKEIKMEIEITNKKKMDKDSETVQNLGINNSSNKLSNNDSKKKNPNKNDPKNKNDLKSKKREYVPKNGTISSYDSTPDQTKVRRKRRTKLKHKRKHSNSELSFSDSNNEGNYSTKSESGSELQMEMKNESNLKSKNKSGMESDSESHSISSIYRNKHKKKKRKKKHKNNSKLKSHSRHKSKRKHKNDLKMKSKIQLKKSRNKSKNSKHSLKKRKAKNYQHIKKKKKKLKSKHKSRLNQIKKHQILKKHKDRKMISDSPKEDDHFLDIDPDLSPISLSKKISQSNKEEKSGKGKLLLKDDDDCTEEDKELKTEENKEVKTEEEGELELSENSNYQNYLQSTPLRNQQFTPFFKYNKMYTPVYQSPYQNTYDSTFSSLLSTSNNYPMMLNLEEANEQFPQYNGNTPLSWEKTERKRQFSNNEEESLIMGNNKTPNSKMNLNNNKSLSPFFSRNAMYKYLENKPSNGNKEHQIKKNEKGQEKTLQPNEDSSSQRDYIYSPNLIFDPLSTSPMTPKVKYTNSMTKKRKTFLINSLQKVSQSPLKTPVSLEKLSYPFICGSTPNVDSPSSLYFKSPSWILSPPAKVSQKKIKKKATMQANATTLFCPISNSYTLSPQKKC
ncbi:transcription repressor myb5 [Anaeramoeba flamelloides]|uniref:Transcription repressor myb5 n=1 Tax=Anaeramoeba flamelloides TaxID=1746091 RepID=A0AAV8AEJ9_9EUKA|nr:transcription repressor myb5 [Anaeramoeba flamelloides]